MGLAGPDGRVGHWVKAVIAPATGSRTYTIDGRAATGKQLRDFLRVRGVNLDTTGAIKQAAVTKLADDNSPQALAAVVAEVSGLSRWNAETQAALEELSHTRRALSDVAANMKKLEGSLAADEEQQKALEQLAELDWQLERVRTDAARVLAQRVAAEAARGQAARSRAAGLEAEVRAQEASLAAAQRHLEQLQQGQQQPSGAADGRADAVALAQRRKQLQWAIAAAEEQVRLDEQLLEQVEADAQSSRRLKAEVFSLQAMLRQRQEEREQVTGMLARMQATEAGQAASDSAQQAMKELDQLLQQARAQQAAAESAASTATARLQQAESWSLQANGALHKAIAKAAGCLDPTQGGECGMEVDGEQDAISTARCGIADVIGRGGDVSGSEDAGARVERQLKEKLQAATLQVQVASQRLEKADQEASAQEMQKQSLEAGLRTLQGPMPPGLQAAHVFELFSLLGDKGGHGLQQNAAALEPYLVALDVIAGSKLGVVVVETAAEAAALLDSNSHGGGVPMRRHRSAGIRVWPLDVLAVDGNLQQRQRAAAEALGTGAVILPLEMVSFLPRHQPAVLRVLGSHVIAVDAATAERLARQYGLSSVTLDGTVSQRGTLQGGWRATPGGVRQTSRMRTKLDLDSCQQLAAACRAAANALKQALASAESQHTALQERLCDLQAARRTVREARAEVQLLQGSVKASEAAVEDAARRVAGLQQAQEGQRELVEAAKQGDGSQGRAQLQRHIREVRRNEAAAQKAVSLLEAKLEEATMQLEAVHQALQQAGDDHPGPADGSDDVSSDVRRTVAAIEGRRNKRLAYLAGLVASVLEVQADLKIAEEEGASRRAALHKGEQQEKAARAALSAAEAALEEAQREASKQQELCARLAKELDSMRALGIDVPDPGQLPGVAGGMGADAPHGQPADTPMAAHQGLQSRAATEQELSQAPAGGVHQTLGPETLAQRYEQLRIEVRRVDARRQAVAGVRGRLTTAAATAPLQALRERQSTLGTLRGKADALWQAVQLLEEGIEASNERVVATNEIAFSAVRRHFRAMVQELVAAVDIDVIKLGDKVHEGLRLTCHGRTPANGSDPSTARQNGGSGDEEDGRWEGSMDQLSGGQRSMASLAFLIAAARVGGANRRRLFLLDEVDAALDEANQAAIAGVLKHLAASGGRGSCQVICVTHNAAFQAVCDSLVQVTAGPHGTCLAPQQASGAGAAAGAGVVQQGTAVGGSAKRSRRR